MQALQWDIIRNPKTESMCYVQPAAHALVNWITQQTNDDQNAWAVLDRFTIPKNLRRELECLCSRSCSVHSSVVLHTGCQAAAAQSCWCKVLIPPKSTWGGVCPWDPTAHLLEVSIRRGTLQELLFQECCQTPRRQNIERMAVKPKAFCQKK